MTETAAHEAPKPERPRHHAELGFAGRVARAFIESPLTPLLLIAFFLVGLLGMVITPREEDPQISVPMVDVFVAYPGATASEVANLVSEPLERLMSELSGVKHVYSMSRDGMSMVTVRFKVGQQMEPSLVKLYSTLYSHMDLIPKGVMQPLVKPKSIDDVPVVTVTLSSSKLDLVQLRKLGLDVLQRFKALPNTGQSFVVGGSREQVRIDVDLPRMASHGVTLGQIAHAVAAANQRAPGGNVVDGGKWFNIYTGEFLANVDDVKNLVIAVDHGRPVFLRDIAAVTHGASETKSIEDNSVRGENGFVTAPAVTVAVAKKHGSNGIDVANELIHELDAMKGRMIPDSVTVTVTRDYGETAQDKVSHLIMKLFIVSVLVTVLALVTMGTRPAMIVLVTIPAVLLMSIAVAYVLNFTINRVSMFALVFAIGILVDDAIVVVENIYRRWLESGRTSDRITVEAVDEVGNPTILATFTVVAALLPMGFVSGMMGPYMLPIPVLSSAAMLFSLFAAFVFVPWLAARVKPSMSALRRAAEREHRQSAAIGRWYSSIITPMMDNRLVGFVTLFLIIAAMMGAVSMFVFKAVAFKMLPFDNKSELQVVIDMPEGTDLFVTANLAHQLGAELRKVPEVTAFQTYVGSSSPFNFNGLVRHYFLRAEPWQGDIAVQLLDKSKRRRSSHEIGLYVRSVLEPIAASAGARLTVAEAPPGPPVLAPMVIELYGPTAEIRRKVARHVLGILTKTPHLVDVNTFVEAPHDNIEFHVDRLRAAMFGVSVEDINREIMMATGGFEAGPLQRRRNLEQAVIVLQTPMATRGNIGNLLVMPVRSQTGAMVPLGELGHFSTRPVDPVIYHKDLRAVEYLTADVIGKLGAPLYGMLDVESELKHYVTPDGVHLQGYFFSRPPTTNVSAFKWDGEWQVTYVTFRDMGLAFGAALVLIYMLVVAEFRSFMLPAVVMTPIPLTLIGIVPGHWLLGADFTATSMIGFIALAGIIVRNSILLVEFAREKVHEGWEVRDAVLTAGRVRLRPIMITALALVIGSMVLLSDPIFQGMAVSLLFGSLVATFLTLIVIPLGCITARKYFNARGQDGDGDDDIPPSPVSPSPAPPPPSAPPEGPAPEGPSPSGAGAPARPARLVRRSEAAPPPAPETSGRPPRLVKKSEAPAAAPEPSEPLAAAPGRPPRLVKKSEQAEVASPEPPPPEPPPPAPAAPAPAPEPPEPSAAMPESRPPARAPAKPPRRAPARRDRNARGIRLKDDSSDPGAQG
ncbi:efflux RND transporter permease subunit [Rhodoblastus acidophilus]|uniref:Efflux RND transporter permease subunit n=1 Tax=Candidatus Rhodoblastus alkanivorans TaxID=2954117 RepID=A0ABS9Z3P4_9HYPH|nr:efflux RND transporter permease subunit [Candidatus Rhodoblastus alkanivorans]MCI4680190.1 efflux RND transporter permease subunit [Candidatus Rhodoblastus alkanivorans]MCI4682288.1 efflux RND transporter permease subunit [Candidatus Rhodoblastus alkanivorans]MDI4639590.1 efflux RND transporter permease subunit [Rhodoblastus acidophilus]